MSVLMKIITIVMTTYTILAVTLRNSKIMINLEYVQEGCVHTGTICLINAAILWRCELIVDISNFNSTVCELSLTMYTKSKPNRDI